MKLVHPLQEFMPYGAPDLIRAQRPDLTRALALSSSFAVLALLGAALLAPLAPNGRTIVPPISARPTAFEPLQLAEPHAALAAKVTPHVRPLDSSGGMPRIVHDDRTQGPEIPPWYDDFAGQVQPGPGEATAPNSSDHGSGPAVDPDAPATYVEEMPVAITEVKPEYPQVARDAMVDGLVIVLVLVGRDGHVRQARLDAKSHVPLLDDAALDAAKRWVFSPATAGGHPVAVWTAIPFRFRLQ